MDLLRIAICAVMSLGMMALSPDWAEAQARGRALVRPMSLERTAEAIARRDTTPQAFTARWLTQFPTSDAAIRERSHVLRINGHPGADQLRWPSHLPIPREEAEWVYNQALEQGVLAFQARDLLATEYFLSTARTIAPVIGRRNHHSAVERPIHSQVHAMQAIGSALRWVSETRNDAYASLARVAARDLRLAPPDLQARYVELMRARGGLDHYAETASSSNINTAPISDIEQVLAAQDVRLSRSQARAMVRELRRAPFDNIGDLSLRVPSLTMEHLHVLRGHYRFAANVPVNINSAPMEVLAELPGIGPRLAHQIFVARESGPFRGPADLRSRVAGFGDRGHSLYRDGLVEF